MPILGSIFNCKSTESGNESDIDLIREVETGKVERKYMKMELTAIKERLNNNNLEVIKMDISYIKQDLNDLKNLLNNLK